MEFLEKYDLRGLDRLLKKALGDETGGAGPLASATAIAEPALPPAEETSLGGSIRALGEALRIQHELIEPEEESEAGSGERPAEGEAPVPRRPRAVAMALGRAAVTVRGLAPDGVWSLYALPEWREWGGLDIEREERRQEAPLEPLAVPRRGGRAVVTVAAVRPAPKPTREVRSVPPAALRLHVPRHTALPLRRRIALALSGEAPAVVEGKKAAARDPFEATALRPVVPAAATAAHAGVADPAEACPPAAKEERPVPTLVTAPVAAPMAAPVTAPLAAPAEVSIGELAGQGNLLSRIPMAAWAGAAILAILLTAGYLVFKPGSVKKPKQTDVAVAAPIAMGGVAWLQETPEGSSARERGLQFSLYRPSMALSDYRVEFEGEVESKGLGWVMRFKDSKNYYAMKIQTSRPGDAHGAVFVRYAVVGGEEVDRFELPLAHKVRAGSKVKVRVDAKGPRLITSVQGQAVNEWSDTKLKTGGFGFLNTREERARIVQVRLSFFKGASVQ
ncbi:MAG: hypothetical protein SFV54_14095 [Bryobacteraceae bacterium]|nr:hypothetical protein [Bryobacteraceae bacterium]